ncbi:MULTISPECIES: hypothetical protein [Sporomusa]|uniref:hypothetical protein n=1 Tax=Sporomusa TaxID=2375 RepID=UPI00095D6A15|nr:MULTISPECIES: hypothetical protein [Sporomusa]OLS54371.1 hypothetical protein SPSPH_44530 [Sporomusa sphaeroides DSM 2875]
MIPFNSSGTSVIAKNALVGTNEEYATSFADWLTKLTVTGAAASISANPTTSPVFIGEFAGITTLSEVTMAKTIPGDPSDD